MYRLSLLAVLIIITCASSRAEEFLKFGAPQEVAPALVQMPNFAQLVKQLEPAVVNISAEGEEAEGEEEATGTPLLKRDGTGSVRSLGSGFIVQEDGYVVTNNHVIQRAEKVIVRLLDDKSEYAAEVLGRDLKTDLALLKINPAEKLKTVFIGNSDDLQVGEWVIAIGNQFQLGHTVSAGIVSALARRVRNPSGSPYDAYIQTDASINPGSSGGPLFNTRGQVIGINTAIFSPGRSQFGGTGFNIGIGFALPINLVRSVIVQLKENGRVTRGLLGVVIQPVDGDVAQILGLKTTDGALVSDVMPGTPAQLAGFKSKDVIISFDGKHIRDYDDLPLMVGDTKIGQSVKVEVLRGGAVKVLSATIAELNEQSLKDDKSEEKPNRIGLVVRALPREESQGRLGVVVKSVEPGSAGAKAGIEREDILEELAGEPIKDVKRLEEVVASLVPEKPVFVGIRKDSGLRYLVLKPRKPTAEPAH